MKKKTSKSKSKKKSLENSEKKTRNNKSNKKSYKKLTIDLQNKNKDIKLNLKKVSKLARKSDIKLTKKELSKLAKKIDIRLDEQKDEDLGEVVEEEEEEQELEKFSEFVGAGGGSLAQPIQGSFQVLGSEQAAESADQPVQNLEQEMGRISGQEQEREEKGPIYIGQKDYESSKIMQDVDETVVETRRQDAEINRGINVHKWQEQMTDISEQGQREHVAYIERKDYDTGVPFEQKQKRRRIR